VNPTQFGPKEDLSRYPRDLKRDLKLCRAEGVDVVFAPSDSEMYPRWGEATDKPARGDARPTDAFSTYVVEEKLSQGMEGKSRPGHFRGVTTVVAKLFNIVQPDVAVFGAKDFQQAAVVKRMVRDLDFPLKIIVAPIVREPDGVAMSSRNKFLSPDERRQAGVLTKAIQKAQKIVLENTGSGRPITSHSLKTEVLRLLAWYPAARCDYIEIFDPITLQPLKTANCGDHIALAVFVGKTRLIDNATL
jgi:pantoate--beta-alanine ligase